ncbi:hypothetical protein PR002_g24312 [Phytophthora rubi]|uniref:Uncharacterized protein n=1 Tax=Phytophthora rubi TaxID=129364 RepID=A0A6A3IEG9_9STRA|nr:hypothetical protein PR002_g24312 [Phytophthora rubi]
MSIALLDLFVPGSGVVLDALSTLWGYCDEMNEGKDVCQRLHRRLKGIFDELQKMDKKGQLPSNNALDEYVSTISKSLGCLDRDSAQVMRELQSTRAQLEAMMVLKYETEQRPDRQTQESIKLMNSMMGTVVRATSTTVQKLPPWFMSSDELKFEKEAFARGSFATVHSGV